jgi:DNA (cytosine-5)-methyltransferase 1
MKVLNLYACLGGNRYKWDEVAESSGINLEITAIELDEELAILYQERFPKDRVLVTDAHQYLLDNYKDFDFIWSSPPCPTHSRLAMTNKERAKTKYPDMKLYEEILLLQHYFKGRYVVENVIPFYDLLIPAKKRGRHLYWTNFHLPQINEPINGIIGNGKNRVEKLSKLHDYDFKKYKGGQPLCKIASNLVFYETGRVIFETSLNIITSKSNQISIFNETKNKTT